MNKKSSDFEEKYKLVSDTIKMYPSQLKQSWDEMAKINLPENFKNVENVIFCGMGGSALGARVVESLFFDQLKIPIKIFNGYKVPNYTNNKSLVILSSYSGSTEETIECYYNAEKKKAKIFTITTGGKLSEICIKDHINSYVFDPIYNPSKQPRLAILYSIGSLMGLLNKLGFISITNEDLENCIVSMNNMITEYNENIIDDRNLPKFYAKKLYSKFPLLVSSDHLSGSTYTLKNQVNECSKTFSVNFEIPELNHHLMEGLKFPNDLKKSMIFIFFESDLYQESIKKRYKITKDVVTKNNYEYLSYKLKSENKLNQAMELIIFGSFFVYHLTKIYKIDPMIIPWVDYFKEQLSAHKLLRDFPCP